MPDHHHHRLRLVLAAAPLLLAAAASPAALAAGATTGRVSVSSQGAQATGGSAGSDQPSVSADGRFVAFASYATNLVAGDTNAKPCRSDLCGRDVFVRDRKTGTTERVSVSSGGAQATGGFADSLEPAISADGRFVAFHSDAANLVPGDTNGTEDVFVRDRKLGTTERVSVSLGGAQGDDDSGDGLAISADGRYVASASIASNLAGGGAGKRTTQVFVRDRKLGTTERVSVSSSGQPGNRESDRGVAISAGGRLVAFASQASNLAPGDTNTHECGEGSCGYDVFVRDREAGTTERVSVGPAGREGNGPSTRPSISANGRYVAFESLASTLLPSDRNLAGDVFVRDRKKGTLEVVSLTSAGAQVFAHSGSASISADGRYVAFESVAGKLVPGDTNGASDVFVRDRRAGTTARASLTSGGGQADGGSTGPAISADGRVVAFSSTATDLVPGDTNGEPDVFVRTR